jgi:hypothetical protein
MMNIFKIIKIITRLFIKSALVKTCNEGMEFSTKYLFPTAPKIPPKLKVILVSKNFESMKKTKKEIKNERKPPKNNLKNK